MRTILLGSYLALLCLTACEGDGSDMSSTGTGGSLTRFAIHGNMMYVATNTTINVYDIAVDTFAFVKEVPVGFALETIFAKGEFLYLGARDAMYIYSIANPSDPTFVFRYAHIVSCDPVVVQGNRAYVTLRAGATCNNNTTNQLDIIDITDPFNPTQIGQLSMTSPGGLAIDGDCLFVCEGVSGLKMLNVSNPLNVTVINSITSINAYDVIARNGMLTLTGEDGIFQFQYDCTAHSLLQLSKIPVLREEL
jgi:hypothetical protein